MTTRYQKSQIEDVAWLFVENNPHRLCQEPPEDCSGCAEFDHLVHQFAALFATDNPLFDRERFLAACGLKKAQL